MFTDNNYISKVEEYVSSLLCDLPDELCYHNLRHTKEVVEASKLLSLKAGLPVGDAEIVIIAAWFHDSGHVITYFGHEEASAKLARHFLSKIHYPSKKIKKVEQCILATCCPQKPTDELQKIICDADMFHLTFTDYENRSFNLKDELETITSRKIPLMEWCEQNIDFLQEHCYFTKYGKNMLHHLKEKNIKKYMQCYCSKELKQ